MSDEKSKKLSKANLVKQPKWTFQCVDPNGYFVIERDNKHVLVSGQATGLIPTSRHPVTGKQRWYCKPIGVTPGYLPNKALDKTFIASRRGDGMLVRLIGQLESKNSKGSHATLNVLAMNTPQNAHSVASPPSAPLEGQTAVRRRRSRKRDFALELKTVAEMRAAGFDPDLRMWFITVYLDESPATLYRKMGTSFPRPVKRDKGSFWPMSVIDTYKAGA